MTTTDTTTVRSGIDVAWKHGTYNIGTTGGFSHAGGEDDSREVPFTLAGDETVERTSVKSDTDRTLWLQ